MTEYKVSDTQLEAEWVKHNIFRIYHCSNCKKTYNIDETTELTPYCGRCGFKMKNPQLVKVEYDFDW